MLWQYGIKTREPSSCWGHQESGTQSGKQREENRKDFKQIAKEGWMILNILRQTNIISEVISTLSETFSQEDVCL